MLLQNKKIFLAISVIAAIVVLIPASSFGQGFPADPFDNFCNALDKHKKDVGMESVCNEVVLMRNATIALDAKIIEHQLEILDLKQHVRILNMTESPAILQNKNNIQMLMDKPSWALAESASYRFAAISGGMLDPWFENFGTTEINLPTDIKVVYSLGKGFELISKTSSIIIIPTTNNIMPPDLQLLIIGVTKDGVNPNVQVFFCHVLPGESVSKCDHTVPNLPSGINYVEKANLTTHDATGFYYKALDLMSTMFIKIP